VQYTNAQTITVISELHDTLQPKIVETKTRKAPLVVSLSLSKTKPKVHTFVPNIAQGKGLFTTYNSDDGLAMDAINWGKTTVCDSEEQPEIYGHDAANVERRNVAHFGLG